MRESLVLQFVLITRPDKGVLSMKTDADSDELLDTAQQVFFSTLLPLLIRSEQRTESSQGKIDDEVREASCPRVNNIVVVSIVGSSPVWEQ